MISLVIPCIPEHLKSLELILNDYVVNTVKPSQTIISLSNTQNIDNTHINYIVNKFSKLLPDFNIITTPKLLNRADNRNKGIESVKYDLVTFSDADDRVHPQRIETILYFFKNNNIDCLIHSYTLKNCFNNNNLEHCVFCKNKNRYYNDKYDIENIDYCKPKMIKEINFPNENILPNVKNIIGWNKDFLQIHPHHGFPTVKKYVLEKVKFNNNYPRGQDSLFCQEVVYNNFNTILVDAELMIYNNNWIPDLSIYKPFNLSNNKEILLDLGAPKPPWPGKPRSKEEVDYIRESIRLV